MSTLRVSSLVLLAAVCSASGLSAQSVYDAAVSSTVYGDQYSAASRVPPNRPGRGNIRPARDPFDLLMTTTAPKPDNSRPVSGVVTVHQLGHRIPGKAKKEFEKAMRDHAKGKIESAIGRLQKAIAVDPQFAVARNDLAAVYLFQGKPDLAIEQLKEAIRIDPHSPMPYSNLAVAYMMKDDAGAAERAARQSVDLDRTGIRNRLLLGMSLVIQNKFTKEAEDSLVQAEPEYPQAGLLLARLLAAQGRLQPAKEQIRRYLASGQTEGAPLAERWMKTLNEATQPMTAQK
jgi:tetratricopeptide (TPR) repeat protein